MQHEILVLEEALQKGNLGGLSIGRIDQYARQVKDMLAPQDDGLLTLVVVVVADYFGNDEALPT